MSTPTIHINSFVRRQTTESEYTHWTFDDAELLRRVYARFSKRQPSYRPDVFCVPIESDGVFTPVRTLQPGDKIQSKFSARREGELPRKHFYIEGEKSPAATVDVVIYSHAALVEDNDAETGCDYEIISVNALPSPLNDLTLDNLHKPIPIQPMTLLANHFGADGGTATGMTAEELETQLRESFEFWQNRIMVKPPGS